MAFALSATAPVSLATPFEKRVAQGFAWVPLVEGDLFGGVASGLAYGARP